MTMISRPRPMWAQVADHLTREITAGTYRPGDLLPSEREMVASFRVSTGTVRRAVSELVAAGLAESQQGKGTRVKSTPSALPGYALERAPRRRSDATLPPAIEAPAVSRTTLTGAAGALLQAADHDAVVIDQMRQDPQTGARIAHRTYVPMATVADVPNAAEPMDPDAIMDQLTAAGLQSLTVTEHVTARGPLPDERTALGMDAAGPILITYRVISSKGRPLMCMELKTSAATTLLTYQVTPPKAPSGRTRASA
ncbi:GntR family transcriptional regulator [Streptomyces uncialis]|uniref:GntR family transcriptional regulator n=1 Tax=Streptomyces uncialis TaxID=1048205 RepID=UPI0022570E5F|nr:winged helix-turn-helix domain-containing protein [Streptomyces uncialis]MCX4663485.1 winged helix-turn-helix domain-containing protein [Streptomyces uncialis]